MLTCFVPVKEMVLMRIADRPRSVIYSGKYWQLRMKGVNEWKPKTQTYSTWNSKAFYRFLP